MPYASNYRDRACCNSPCEILVVERHHVFERTASPDDENDLRTCIYHATQSFDDAYRRLSAFYRHAGKVNGCDRKPSAKSSQHIVHRSAAWRCHKAYLLRIERQGPFASRIGQAFSLEFLCDVGNFEPEIPLTCKSD